MDEAGSFDVASGTSSVGVCCFPFFLRFFLPFFFVTDSLETVSVTGGSFEDICGLLVSWLSLVVLWSGG